MDYFTTTCPHCQSSLNVPNKLFNQNIKCGGCSKEFTATPNEKAPEIATVAAVDTPSPKNSNEEASRFTIVQTGIACFLFGCIGLHAFYVGRKAQGAILAGLMVLGLIGYFKIGFDAGSYEYYKKGFSFTSLAPFFIYISFFCAIGDLIRILMGKYKDGEGKSISAWS